MPSLPLLFNELNTEQILVDIKNCWDYDGHREVFLHQRIIEAKGFLHIDAVVIAIVPDIKLSVEGKPKLLAFLFLECKKYFAFFGTDWFQFFTEVI